MVSVIPLGSAPVIAVHIGYRSAGYQRPLRDDDEVYVYHARTSELLFVARGALVTALLRHYLDALSLHALLQAELDRKPSWTRPEPPDPLVTPVIPSEREVRRAQRRARKRRA